MTYDRSGGPWDVAEVDFSAEVERLDLGGLQVLPTTGVDVQLQVDEASGSVMQVTLGRPDGGVQVQPFAAARTEGLWDTVRPQIKASINSGGGLVEEVEGTFGTELRAQVKVDGSSTMQPARFVGIDGPRWFLRAVFLGGATRPGETADVLEQMLRDLVVVRGSDAMPVGAPIPLVLPDASEQPQESVTIPSPFVRGPEITETR